MGQALHYQLHYQLLLLPTHFQAASTMGAVAAAQLLPAGSWLQRD
jgi:hypothetical protein